MNRNHQPTRPFIHIKTNSSRAVMQQASVAELEASGADPFDALLTLEDHFLASGFAAGAQASQFAARCCGCLRRSFHACAGQLHGREKGQEAGWELGYQKGHELGLELGQYRGRVDTLLAISAAHTGFASARCASVPNHGSRGFTRLARRRHGSHGAPRVAVSRRILATLTRLHTLLATIKLDDPLDQRCFDALDDVRARMRMVDVWLKGRSKAGSDADADDGAASAGAAAGGGGGSGDLTAGPSTPLELTVDLSF